MPRFYCPTMLHVGDTVHLPAGAARHVQVLRLQPGDAVTLFNNGPAVAAATVSGGEFAATITRMGRTDVHVHIDCHIPLERECQQVVHLALGVPANERMDWLVEKATEIGVASLQPLLTERSVLRLTGERADKKVAHWQAIAIAACEQCGANRVPAVHPFLPLAHWLKAQHSAAPHRCLLSLHEDATPLAQHAWHGPVVVLSGPEGGLSASEEAAAIASGFVPLSLGARILRAETAALAALVRLAA